MSFIKGNFRKYIFKSDRGYVVGLFKVRDTSEDLISLKNSTITFTGYFSDLNESDLYLFNGKMTNHERYGEQFLVESYEITLPNDKDNIVEFLSSNLFPGIGETKASKIVDVLKENCLDIIMENPDSLFLVPTVTKKQRDIIYNNLVKYQSSYKTIVDLNKYGFNTKDSLSIYNKYKDSTNDIVCNNVYQIIDDIYDISFKKIDQVRNNFSIKDNDIRRIEAGIKYVLDELSYSSGNTYFSYNEIIAYTKRALFITDENVINDAIEKLKDNLEIVEEDNKYYLYKMYNAEKSVGERIFCLANHNTLDIINDDIINDNETYFNIKYNEDQLKAIKAALKNKFLVITGGPGTGKTTIIKAITKIYQEVNGLNDDELIKNLALLAPTGRAAKRISEQTLLPASTIHRFLKWNKEDNTFNINEENPSDVKFVIIDEASMIDTYLLHNLFLGLKENTRIVIIGDYNQLPSVGPGQILKDIIESECIDVVKLNKLYRQEEDSNISLLAHDINNNNLDFSIFNEYEDLTFIKSDSQHLKEYLKEYILQYSDLSFNNFQVLAPIYKGDNGIDELNYFMQEILNPKDNKKIDIITNGITYREDDKVLQLVNMVDENIFNGDIGKIIKIKDGQHKEIIVDFDSNIVRFTPANFLNIKLGYTISIHKSQGSEFDVVIIPILNKYNTMLYKKLIYTGITRAKKKLILIGEEEALKKAIFNDKENIRKTNLKNFITSCIK